jgi:excisionase family DNA binding protein
MNKLLTAQEVADLLSIKKTTVYQLKARKEIPFVKIGGCIRFEQSQIENWIKTKGDADGQN